MNDDADVKERIKPNILEIIRADDAGRFAEIIREGHTVFGTYPYDRTVAHLCAMFGAEKVLSEAVGYAEFDPWHKDAGGKFAIDHALAKNYTDIHNILYHAMYPSRWFLEDSGEFGES